MGKPADAKHRYPLLAVHWSLQSTAEKMVPTFLILATLHTLIHTNCNHTQHQERMDDKVGAWVADEGAHTVLSVLTGPRTWCTSTRLSLSATPAQPPTSVITCLIIWINKYVVKHFCLHFALLSLPSRPLPSRLKLFSYLNLGQRDGSGGKVLTAKPDNLSLIRWTLITKADNFKRYKWLYAFLLEYGLTRPPL